jgi:hypothetical protein
MRQRGGRTAKIAGFFDVTVLTLENPTDYIRVHTRAAPLLAALRFTSGSLDESRDGVRFGEQSSRMAFRPKAGHQTTGFRIYPGVRRVL